MAQYTHYFNLKLAGSFSSGIGDFERAFAAYCAAAPCDEALRKDLLGSDDLQTIVESVEWHDTDCDDP